MTNSILAALLLVGTSLYAESYDSNDFGGVENAGQKAEEESGAFNVHTGFDYIGSTEIDKHGFHHDHIKYSNVEVGGGAVVYYESCIKEGVQISLNYNRTKFRNPFYHQSIYNTINVGVAGFTSRACDWDWQAYVAANIDTDHPSFEYTTYDFLVWGRYDYCPDYLGFNIGIIGETGLKADRVLPVIGVDWKINECWKLNAVFPINMSLIYKIDENWSADIVGRVFSSRHRVGKHEPIPKGIWIYRNAGIEAGLNYDLCTFHVNCHIGYTVGGRVKIANRHYEHSHRYNLDSAPYAGGEVSYRF